MKILLVEDDEKLNYSLRFQLEKEGFTVTSCFDGEDALHHIDHNLYDLILLDRMIPLIDGLSILNYIRKNYNTTPVIIITALGELQDKVTGLDHGADDYLVKPFDFEELMARIRCIIRRLHSVDLEEMITIGDIVYYPMENRLQCMDHQCILSKKEGQLLEVFLHSKDMILSREMLITKVWGLDSEIEDGNLDNYIHFIRRRIKSINSHINIITLRGIGYRLSIPD